MIANRQCTFIHRSSQVLLESSHLGMVKQMLTVGSFAVGMSAATNFTPLSRTPGRNRPSLSLPEQQHGDLYPRALVFRYPNLSLNTSITAKA